MLELKEMLPFLIPVILLQLIIFAYSLYHILTHDHYKCGTRAVWVVVVVVLMNFVGPILYLILGREEA